MSRLAQLIQAFFNAYCMVDAGVGVIPNLIILSLGGTASAPRREETKGEKETQTGKGGEKDGQGRSIIIWDGTGYQICRISGIYAVARQDN